jgi:hypothetical protein
LPGQSAEDSQAAAPGRAAHAPLVEVLEVVHAPASGKLLRSHLDSPRGAGDERSGTAGDTYAFEVSGWALGKDRPVAAIELVTQDDTGLWRVKPQMERPDVAAAYADLPHAQACGFYLPISSLAMPSRFEVHVRAVLDDDSRADIATIRGRREPLRPALEPRQKPLMITTVGRTGSTAFFSLLERHPQILAYRPFQYETRVATYWVDVMRSLSEPSSYLRQLAPDANLSDRAWWLGMRAPLRRKIVDEEIQTWMGVNAVEALVGFCQTRIEALYDEIAEYFDQRDAVYFAERYVPTVVPYLMWEMYPQARELILVRDFRDMVASIMAFDAKRGFYGFDRPPGESDEAYIRHLGQRVTKRLLGSWRERSARAHLVRYEDIVQHPEETIVRILEYLELDRDPQIVDTMRRSLWERTAATEQHRTTAAPEASIGRWRTDLAPELQRACEQSFGEALEEFGYLAEPDP